jgi:hypothetical protein
VTVNLQNAISHRGIIPQRGMKALGDVATRFRKGVAREMKRANV